MSFTNVQKQPPPMPVVDEATIKARIAAARAYALSSSSNSDFQTPSPPKTDAIDGPEIEKTNQSFIPNIQDEDYAIFVKTLTDEDFFQSLSDNIDDDPEEFLLDAVEEDDEEEEFSSENMTAVLLPSDTEDEGDPFTIETELGLLMEEDLENAVTTLLSQHPPTPDNLSDSPPRTPLRECSRNSVATVSLKQLSRLKHLMKRHYQLLVQQAVLSVRAISKKHSHHGGESADDLADILDGAVGMLQDLDQNRKDAIRTSIQLKQAKNHNDDKLSDGRLTRAAFSKTLQQAEGETTTFDVAGLAHLKSLFATIDNTKNIVEVSDPKQACMQLLEISDYEPEFLPGAVEYSQLLSQGLEVFGDDFKPPCTAQQIQALKRDRNQFTAGEDSLVFRGVNLYGEKQWLLIADRFLPDRSINIISQRYSKLSLLLFKAHGINIDNNGSLVKPPKLDSIDKADKTALATLKRVEPPAILNVHRWSIEEDLMLLKAVPVLGHMWAELSARLVPHRDRGHLRKRYQVLERRVKATVTRAKKEGPRLSKKQGKAPPHFLKKRACANNKLSTEASTQFVQVSKIPAKTSDTILKTSLTSKYDNISCDDHPTNNGPSHQLLPPLQQPHLIHQNQKHQPYQVPSSDGLHQESYIQERYLVSQLEDTKESFSRYGVEQILNNDNANDDSQLARVQEMMKNDRSERALESEVASTISQLSKGSDNNLITPKAVIDLLQKNLQIYHSEASNRSHGLDMLAANAREGESPVKPMKGSILTSVFERANRQDCHLKASRNSGSPSRKSGTPLTSPVVRVGYSPAGSFLPMSPPSSSAFLFANNSQDSFGFEISDRSRQMLGTPSKLPSLESNSTMEDLDAASALKSLSNSPTRSRLFASVAKESGVKRSLFDRAIKKSENRNKKRKL